MVAGFCPMGCGETLQLAELVGGQVVCLDENCPRPTAAAELLADRETDHIVELGETEFTVRHPLRERLDDALMECSLHRRIAGLFVPAADPGRYRVVWPLPEEGWAFVPVSASPVTSPAEQVGPVP